MLALILAGGCGCGGGKAVAADKCGAHCELVNGKCTPKAGHAGKTCKASPTS